MRSLRAAEIQVPKGRRAGDEGLLPPRGDPAHRSLPFRRFVVIVVEFPKVGISLCQLCSVPPNALEATHAYLHSWVITCSEQRKWGIQFSEPEKEPTKKRGAKGSSKTESSAKRGIASFFKKKSCVCSKQPKNYKFPITKIRATPPQASPLPSSPASPAIASPREPHPFYVSPSPRSY